MVSSYSRHSSNTVDAKRLAELERRLAAVEKRLDGQVAPDDGGWKRKLPYARSKDISVRTVDRRVEAGLLEQKKEGNCAYVREIARPAPPPRPRRRGRVSAPGDDGLLRSATPGVPVWPFTR
jgi:hypothetical protein